MKQVFESENISYVEVSELLVNDYLVMVNDHENVNRFLGSRKRDIYTEDDEIAWVNKKLEEKDPVFSMIEKKSGDFIGNIELVYIRDPVRELGIAITAKKQDKGFGSEAIRAVTEFGFKTLGLEKIVLRVRLFNDRAIHVYRNCGFQEYDRNDEHVFMEIEPEKKSP
ncbi:MAG: GNAT family N-acetyltransferase [Erysipelotrichaceae bacterium]|nr:GNAT family N-acetyltransferase [Erysipelotrichaceae bacterium]